MLNDEAHHCYQDKLLEAGGDADREDQERNRDARVWFRGLCDLRRQAGIKAVYDLSATPYYLKGSGYNEGFIFPWVVSDFSLMDAIESGIVKVPRIPVDDDAAGDGAGLPAAVGPHRPPLPKRRALRPRDRRRRAAGLGAARGARRRAAQPLPQLRADLRPLRGTSWPRSASRRRCSSSSARTRSSPSWSSTGSPGRDAELAGRHHAAGPRQPAAAQQRRGRRLDHPAAHDPRRLRAARVRRAARSRLQEGGGTRDRGVQAVLPAAQPGRRRRQAHRRGPAARGDEHRRQEGQARRAHPLRRLGLDAHRGLGRQHRHPHPRRPPVPQPAAVRAGRRPRPAPPQLRGQPGTGHFEPEYAEVYGVPFAFIPGDRPIPKPRDPRPAVEVRALPDRWDLAIQLPQARRLPGRAARRDAPRRLRRGLPLHLDRATVALWVEEPGRRRRRVRGRPRRHPQRSHPAHRVRHRQDADRAGAVLRRARRRAAAMAVPAARRDHPAVARRVRHDRHRA